jgi:hypothetical protein
MLLPLRPYPMMAVRMGMDRLSFLLFRTQPVTDAKSVRPSASGVKTVMARLNWRLRTASTMVSVTIFKDKP